ncbi:MAG: dockerin type I domain-containing protein, partial [Pirellulaceae bacterium]|nr:dockerin type I domain-containing protein [Pirellulaceae bacterium]
DLEDIRGGRVDDFLRGSRGPNRLEGGEGDDTLDGTGGADVLIGGPGANLLIGGAGDDRYVFTNGVAAVDTLVENAGSVVGGVLSVGGIDTLDLSDVEDAVTFDLSHFVPDVDPFDGQDRIPEFVPGVVPGVLEIDLHDRTAPLDDHTRTGEHFETVVLHGGQLGLGFRLASARGNTDLTNPTATSDPASKTEPMQGDIGFLGTPGTRGGRALGEGDSPCLEVRLIPVAVPTAEDATELPSPLDSVLPGQVFFLELWALSIVEPSAGVAGGMVDIEYPSGIVTAGPPAFPSWLELISGSVAASAGLIDDWGGVILARDAGVDPDWVRLGHIPFTVIGQGNLSFDLLPGEFPFALMGMGNVAWTDVVMFDAQLAVIPVNQPPVIATSGSQTLAANTTTTLPLIQLSDPDGAADARLTVTLSVLHGTLLLNTAGVDVVAGGNRKALVSLAGTVAALNAALRTLGYRSHADFAGSDALTIIAQETDGSGGSGLTATAVVALQVQARPLPYRNPRLHLDVNDDGHVSPRDALIIINLLNREGTQQLLAPTEHFVPPDFLDTSGDNWVSPRDALLIINYLNASPSGEGEAALSPEDALQLAAKADGPSIQRSRASSELRDSLWAEETDWLPGTDTLTDREHATATVLSGRTSRWRSRELQMSSTMYTLPNGTGTSDGLLARSPGRNRRSPNRTS